MWTLAEQNAEQWATGLWTREKRAARGRGGAASRNREVVLF